jgi:hypothetical protein
MQIFAAVTHLHVETVLFFLEESYPVHVETTRERKLFYGWHHAFQEIGNGVLLVGFESEPNYHPRVHAVVSPVYQMNEPEETFQLKVRPSWLVMVCPFPVLQTFQVENPTDFQV